MDNNKIGRYSSEPNDGGPAFPHMIRPDSDYNTPAALCYRMADSMLAARVQPKDKP